jgi:hypothetical protein
MAVARGGGVSELTDLRIYVVDASWRNWVFL